MELAWDATKLTLQSVPLCIGWQNGKQTLLFVFSLGSAQPENVVPLPDCLANSPGIYQPVSFYYVRVLILIVTYGYKHQPDKRSSSPDDNPHPRKRVRFNDMISGTTAARPPPPPDPPPPPPRPSMDVADGGSGGPGSGPESIPPRTRSRIRFATYNIISGRNSRLQMALRAMDNLNVDFGILTETKLTDGIYTRYSSGYNIDATSASSSAQGGVALFFRNSQYFQVESVVKHGPNVMSFEFVTGFKRQPAFVMFTLMVLQQTNLPTITKFSNTRRRNTSHSLPT